MSAHDFVLGSHIQPMPVTVVMPQKEPCDSSAPALEFRPDLPDPGPNCQRLSDLITATDEIAKHIEVYDERTGEVVPLVHSVCVREGWLKRFVTVPGPHGPLIHAKVHDGQFSLELFRGPWRIRPRSQKKERVTRGLPSPLPVRKP